MGNHVRQDGSGLTSLPDERNRLAIELQERTREPLSTLQKELNRLSQSSEASPAVWAALSRCQQAVDELKLQIQEISRRNS